MLAEKGEPINWVERRATCTIKGIFNCLRKRFDDDVKHMNCQSKEVRNGFAYIMQSNSSLATVKREPKNHMELEESFVTMAIREERIFVKPLKTPEFEVLHKWDDKSATCILYVDDEQYEVWQISQKALKDLFFS